MAKVFVNIIWVSESLLQEPGDGAGETLYYNSALLVGISKLEVQEEKEATTERTRLDLHVHSLVVAAVMVPKKNESEQTGYNRHHTAYKV